MIFFVCLFFSKYVLNTSRVFSGVSASSEGDFLFSLYNLDLAVNASEFSVPLREVLSIIELSPCLWLKVMSCQQRHIF